MVNSLLIMLLASSSGLQDPTRPLNPIITTPEVSASAPKTQAPAFRLQAIFTGGTRPSVIIDSKRQHIGDTIGGYRLSHINAGQVILSADGKPLTLTLFPLSTILSKP